MDRVKEVGKGFKIKRIVPVDPNDPRGPLREWKLPDGRQITIASRKAGTKGGHYHKGKDPSKDPERILVVLGRVKMTFINRNNGQEEKRILEAGDSVEISSWTGHRSEFLEDTVIVEYRVTYFDKKNPDTFPLED